MQLIKNGKSFLACLLVAGGLAGCGSHSTNPLAPTADGRPQYDQTIGAGGRADSTSVPPLENGSQTIGAGGG